MPAFDDDPESDAVELWVLLEENELDCVVDLVLALEDDAAELWVALAEGEDVPEIVDGAGEVRAIARMSPFCESTCRNHK